MEHYPLMFIFRDAVSGDGFLAGVTVCGRALIVKEGEGDWCVYGVRPAAIAETGATAEEAYLRLRNRYKTVLYDVASESRDFDTFKRETEQFYYAPDPDEESRWEKAAFAIGTQQPEIEEPFLKTLPLESPEEMPSSIAVAKLDENKRFKASDNVADRFAVAKVVGAAA